MQSVRSFRQKHLTTYKNKERKLFSCPVFFIRFAPTGSRYGGDAEFYGFVRICGAAGRFCHVSAVAGQHYQ